MKSLPKKRRRTVRLEVVQNGRTLPKAEADQVLAGISQRFADIQQGKERSRLQRRLDAVKGPPDKSSIGRAMILVEARLAKAFWTIAQQTSSTTLMPIGSSRHGISYLHDPDQDTHARYVDAPSGDWKSVIPPPPRPIPSSREIDAAAEAQSWLAFVDEDDRKLFIMGLTSKRGDAGRRIDWKRIIPSRPELKGIPLRTLQQRYQNALLSIVLALALARAA